MLESLWILKFEVHPSERKRGNNRGKKQCNHETTKPIDSFSPVAGSLLRISYTKKTFQKLWSIRLKKYFVLVITLLFGNAAYADGHGSVYLVDFKCDQEAYKVFASMTLEELDGQFLKGSTKLARYHDLTSGSGIALVESEDPSLVIEFTNGWSELCESTITPVVNDKKAMAILTKK